jgi:hypothetical protein
MPMICGDFGAAGSCQVAEIKPGTPKPHPALNFDTISKQLT